jgi:hypothetical protein
MSANPNRPTTIVPVATTAKEQSEANVVADASGRGILALIQKASDMAREDCARAMDMAHKLSFQMRAAEERVRELESETAHYRDRAARAEAWLERIRNEVDQMFFHPKERETKQI